MKAGVISDRLGATLRHDMLSAPWPSGARQTKETQMAEWIDACATGDIDKEDLIRFDHGSRTFVIVRDHQDNSHCSDGLCTHEDVHLENGLVVNAMIECPKHSSIFDCTTGEMETPPACENLHTYPTKVENGRIFVEL